MSQFGINGIQIRPDASLRGGVKTAPINEWRYGRPHALHVIEEDVNSQIPESSEFLDESSNSRSVIIGFFQEVVQVSIYDSRQSMIPQQ